MKNKSMEILRHLDSKVKYISYDGTVNLSALDAKNQNINFYNNLTSYRCLLKDIDDSKKDIKHILKTILESNSTYFVVGTDIADMNSTLVFGKVDLVKILKKYDFDYGIAFIAYDGYLLSLDLFFKLPISEFSNSKNIDLFLSYDDLANIAEGINLDNTMLNNWNMIQHWWKQKESFKQLD